MRKNYWEWQESKKTFDRSTKNDWLRNKQYMNLNSKNYFILKQ